MYQVSKITHRHKNVSDVSPTHTTVLLLLVVSYSCPGYRSNDYMLKGSGIGVVPALCVDVKCITTVWDFICHW